MRGKRKLNAAFALLLLAQLWASYAAASLAPRCSASNNNSGGASTLSINVCGSTQNGDLMIAAIFNYGGVALPPAGWQFIRDWQGPLFSGSRYMSFFYRYASSEPASYSFPVVGGYAVGGIAVYSGAIGSGDPIDGISFNTGTGATLTANSISPAQSDDYLLTFFFVDNNSDTVTLPGGSFSTEWNISGTGSNFGGGLADEALSGSGSTGNVTASQSYSGNWAAVQIAIKASDAAAPAVTVRCSSTNAVGNASLPISVCGATQNGDLMIAPISWYDGCGSLQTPSGWTKCTSCDAVVGSRVHGTVFYRYASSEPSSYTFSCSGGGTYGGGGILVLKGAVPSGYPFDVVSTNTGSASTSWLTNSITTTTAGDYLLVFVASDNSASSGQVPDPVDDLWE
ncbi:MAG: hypothetical protein ABSD31_21815, partial [Candidatus Binataceae bacterium]